MQGRGVGGEVQCIGSAYLGKLCVFKKPKAGKDEIYEQNVETEGLRFE